MFEDGTKTLRDYSAPVSLARFGKKWITAEEELFTLVDAVNDAPHFDVVPKENSHKIRKADPIELTAGKLLEWQKSNPRT